MDYQLQLAAAVNARNDALCAVFAGGVIGHNVSPRCVLPAYTRAIMGQAEKGTSAQIIGVDGAYRRG